MSSLLANTKILQSKPTRIRNICILAHVDHGKTTLSDNLIASNGIISERLAGQLRFLDSREDEQERGITMQSSAISLLFVDPREKRKLERQAKQQNIEIKLPLPYLINLIDSPGHVDFSSDVSTAVRLCDGALVVVDAVEGVCIQTQAVLRQAWEERVKPCLVINKVDRLINEVFLTPLEAFHHLRQIIERVNALVSQLSNADAFAKAEMNKKNKTDCNDSNESKEKEQLKEEQEEEKDAVSAASMQFDPIKGNVIFASAIHGWGFTLGPFATLLSKKLKVNRNVLLKHLWGDFFFNPTKKSVTKKSTTNKGLPMIAKYILEPIWMMYNTVLIDQKPKKAVRMAKALGVEVDGVTEKILKNPDQLIKTIMKSWLSLSNSVLSCAVSHIPNPMEAQRTRSDRLFPTRKISTLLTNEMGSKMMSQWNQIHNSVRTCLKDGPLVAFVSKMIAVPKGDIPKGSKAIEEILRGDDGEIIVDGNSNSNEMTFVAFARIFSGTLRANQPLCIMGPKYDPFSDRMRPLLVKHRKMEKDQGVHESDVVLENVEHSKDVKDVKDGNDGNDGKDGNDAENATDVTGVLIREVHHCSKSSNVQPMLMMGSSFELLDSVGPGNIVAIHGLGNHILKTATLSENLMCPTFSEMSAQATPILSVAIEPKNIQHIAALRHGLALLNHADPCVEISLSSQGEMVIYALGN